MLIHEDWMHVYLIPPGLIIWMQFKAKARYIYADDITHVTKAFSTRFEIIILQLRQTHIQMLMFACVNMFLFYDCAAVVFEELYR